MKMRKLFAGIAAAATLLAGMALGAASAQADPTTAAEITVTNAAAGSELTTMPRSRLPPIARSS